MVRSLGLLLLVGLMCAIGCSSATSVSGPVSFKGEPVTAGYVRFVGKGVYGGPIKDGKYEISAEREIVPGDYKVEISWPKPTGRQVPTGEDGSNQPEMQEAIPEKYNKNTTLTATVKSGMNEIPFKLDP